MTAVLWLIFAGTLLVGSLGGYIYGVLRPPDWLRLVRERQRVEDERRLAELQLHRLTHHAMQGLLYEARRG